jgi:hypothetical protein
MRTRGGSSRVFNDPNTQLALVLNSSSTLPLSPMPGLPAWPFQCPLGSQTSAPPFEPECSGHSSEQQNIEGGLRHYSWLEPQHGLGAAPATNQAHIRIRELGGVGCDREREGCCSRCERSGETPRDCIPT